MTGIGLDKEDKGGQVEAQRLLAAEERVLDEISFTAPDRAGDTVTIDATYVRDRVESLSKNADLSRFIL